MKTKQELRDEINKIFIELSPYYTNNNICILGKIPKSFIQYELDNLGKRTIIEKPISIDSTIMFKRISELYIERKSLPKTPKTPTNTSWNRRSRYALGEANCKLHLAEAMTNPVVKLTSSFWRSTHNAET